MASLRALPVLLLFWGVAEAIPVQDRLVDLLAQPSSALASLDKVDEVVEYRLPTDVNPTSYNIRLNPHFEEKNFTFDGESVIDLQVLKETQDVKFHVGTDMKIENTKLVKVETNKETPVDVESVVVETKTDICTIHLKNKIAAGNYRLTLVFQGVLNGHMRGFYRSNYTDNDGNLRWLATTHFEPVGARLAFPCWDEPAFKATFTISLKHAEDYGAISNMPKEKDSPVDSTDKKLWTHFKTTPKMSTYLVAFVVSDYGVKAHKDDKNFAVWTRKNALHQVDYALGVGKMELEKLNNFTDFPYVDMGMPKMDSISIPHFSPGAMENWGLVTYRESGLLYDDNVTTTAAKQGIATVISHEFAHQWFGNLVSPKWWTYLWLNEGFATYFQYYITDQVEDNWRTMEQFVVKALQGRAFVADAKEDTRPMNHEVNSPDEISALFDSISYQKAGSVIRMMSHILTEDVFKDGLRSYLKEKKFDVATSDDLFTHLQKAADASQLFDKNFPFKKIMESWVTQKGYPVVSVYRNYIDATATLFQERFVINKTEVKDDIKWWIPITHAMKGEATNNTLPTEWLKPEGKLLQVKLENKSDHWVLFNIDQTGYYRVNYDVDNWYLLIKELNSTDYKNIPVLNRAQLINDALNLARSGRLSYSVALDLTTYLDKEIDYIPWVSAFSEFSYLDTLLRHSEHYGKFKIYMQRQIRNVLNSVGYEGKADHITKLTRVDAVYWACYYGWDTCEKFATQQLKLWLENNEMSSPDLKSTILCTALRNADLGTWNDVFNKYNQSTDKDEKDLLLSSLACSSSDGVLDLYLNLFKEDRTMFEKVVNLISVKSTIGLPTVLEFLTKNIETIRNITEGTDTLKKIVTNIGKIVTIEDHLYKLTSFIVDVNQPDVDIHEGIMSALDNLRSAKKLQPQIASWLNRNNFVVPTENNDGGGASSLAFASLLGLVAFLLTRIY